MELLQLKYFLEVAESEHINKTAEKLMVTPSAISISISKLEREIGVSLFDRKGRNIVLNDRGRIFEKHIKDMFFSLDEAQKSVKSYSQGGLTTLEIYTVNPYLWNKPIKDFQNMYPNISIVLTALDIGGVTKTPQEIVNSSYADLFIAAREYFINCNIESELLFDSPIYLAMSKKHKLAKRRSIRLEELKDEWFINSPKDTNFRHYCDELCLNAGFIPKSHVECDYMVRPNILNSQPDSVCICTFLGKESGLYENTSLIPIVHPETKRTFMIAWNSKRRLSQQAQTFKDYLQKYYTNYPK